MTTFPPSMSPKVQTVFICFNKKSVAISELFQEGQHERQIFIFLKMCCWRLKQAEPHAFQFFFMVLNPSIIKRNASPGPGGLCSHFSFQSLFLVLLQIPKAISIFLQQTSVLMNTVTTDNHMLDTQKHTSNKMAALRLLTLCFNLRSTHLRYLNPFKPFAFDYYKS